MSTTCPAPFPANGQSAVTHEQAMQRMQAMAHQLPAKLSTDCESRIQVGIFFDGTNNNMKLDYEDLPPEKRKHTNIVKLFQAFPYKPESGLISYYIPGVGTPFPEIGDNNKPSQTFNIGSSVAEMGEHRIIWAMCQMVNAPHEHVKGAKNLLITDSTAKATCTTLSDVTTPAALRRSTFTTWQNKLKTALRPNKPRVVQINLSVFGFSRGAAEARVFVNWLLDVCDKRGNQYFFADIELNVAFLGIFDTVASVGTANLFDNGVLTGHQGWANNALEIHPAVRRCVHYVAAHEVRACFPLDSVRVKSQYPTNALEVMYPGVHSDVGGGYAPGEVGAGPRPADNLSIIPGRDMYEAARNAGVPLTPWAKLPDYVIAAWTPSEELIKSYNSYLKNCGVGPGSVEQMHHQHMALHHSYRYKWRREFLTRKMAYIRANTQPEKQNLLDVQNRFIRAIGFGLVDHYRSDELPRDVANRFENMSQASGIPMSTHERRALDVARSINPQHITTAVEHLFDWFMHDSIAGFKADLDEYAFNKLGLAKFRTVYKGND